jgi:hypothetical protein
VAGGADAGDAGRCLVRIGLEPGDQPLEVVGRQAVLADDQQGFAADLPPERRMPRMSILLPILIPASVIRQETRFVERFADQASPTASRRLCSDSSA